MVAHARRGRRRTEGPEVTKRPGAAVHVKMRFQATRGRIDYDEQVLIAAGPGGKILWIIATPVAETSIAFPNLVAVVGFRTSMYERYNASQNALTVFYSVAYSDGASL